MAYSPIDASISATTPTTLSTRTPKVHGNIGAAVNASSDIGARVGIQGSTDVMTPRTAAASDSGGPAVRTCRVRELRPRLSQREVNERYRRVIDGLVAGERHVGLQLEHVRPVDEANVHRRHELRSADTDAGVEPGCGDSSTPEKRHPRCVRRGQPTDRTSHLSSRHFPRDHRT